MVGRRKNRKENNKTDTKENPKKLDRGQGVSLKLTSKRCP